MKSFSTLALAAILAVGLVGCTQEAREKYDAAGDAIGKGAEKTGEAVSTDAKVAGEAIEDGAQEVKENTDAAMMTGKIRSAIESANDVEIEDLNVDTLDDQKKVILKGQAKDQKSKDQAATVAKGMVGDDYTIDNQITVASGG